MRNKSKETAALPKQQHQAQARTLDTGALRLKVFDLFDRYDATRHTGATFAVLADIIAHGTRLSEPKLYDEDCDKQLTMQMVQHLHRERTKNGHKTPKKRTRVKERMPLFGVGAHFGDGGRKDEDITALTGYAQADIDDHDGTQLAAIGTNAEQVRDILARDPHTAMAYVTVSRGVRPVFPYEMPRGLTPGEQKKFYGKACEAAIAHYTRILAEAGISGAGELFDRSVSKPVQLAALAYDPGVCLATTPPVPFTASEAEAAWADHEAAVKAAKAQEQTAQRAKADTARAKRKATATRRRIDKFYDETIRPSLEAKGEPFKDGHRDNHVCDVACWLNRRGERLEDVLAWAPARLTEDGYTEDEMAETISKAFARYADEHATEKPHEKKERTRLAAISDIEQWLLTQGQFRHNDITGKAEWNPANAGGNEEKEGQKPDGDPDNAWLEMDDTNVNTLRCRMSTQLGLFVRKGDVEDTLYSEFSPAYNPIASYLESVSGNPVFLATQEFFRKHGTPLPPERSPIARLAATVRMKGGAEVQDYWVVCFRKWFVALAATCCNAEEVNELLLVLTGGQGSFKTTWLRRLVPPRLSRYVLVKTDASTITKDDKIAMCERLIIILEELDTFTDRELSQLKAAVTMPWVNERPPYGRHTMRRKHIASFCATGNNIQFLADRTGNRRFLPFEVESIQDPRTIAYDYDALYAEAAALAKAGFRYWLDAGDMALQARHNRHFETPCMERELVERFYRQPLPDEAEKRCFVTATMAMQAFGGTIAARLTAARVGTAFTALGFKKVSVKGIRGYRAVLRSNDELMRHEAVMGNEAQDDE